MTIEFLHVRLTYIELRINQIVSSYIKTTLLIWAKTYDEVKALRSSQETCNLLPFAEPVVQKTAPPGQSFLEQLHCLNMSTLSAPARAVTTTVTSTVAPVVAAASRPQPPVSFMPPMHSSLSISDATPPPMPPASSLSFSQPPFNKYVQVSRWKLTYNGVGNINAFIERVEGKAVSFGVRDNLERVSNPAA